MSSINPLMRLGVGRDETPHSYWSRLAMHHGRSFNGFCTDMGLLLDCMLAGTLHIARLCGVSHLAPDTFAGRSTAEMFKSLADRRSSRQQFVSNWLRLCPHCVSEDLHATSSPELVRPYHRARWMLPSLHTCIRHRTVLMKMDKLDDVPACDFATHIRPVVAELPRWIDASVQRDPSPLERWLDESFLSDPVGREVVLIPASTGNNPSLNGSPQVIASMAEAIGAAKLYGRRLNIDDLSAEDWRVAGGVGFEILRGGTDTVLQVIEELRQDFLKSDEKWRDANVLGAGFHHLLMDKFDHPAFDELKNVIRNYLADRCSFFPGNSLLGQRMRFYRVLSLGAIKGELFTWKGDIREALKDAGVIEQDTDDIPDDRLLVRIDEARDVLRSICIIEPAFLKEHLRHRPTKYVRRSN